MMHRPDLGSIDVTDEEVNFGSMSRSFSAMRERVVEEIRNPLTCLG